MHILLWETTKSRIYSFFNFYDEPFPRAVHKQIYKTKNNLRYEYIGSFTSEYGLALSGVLFSHK